MWIEGQVLQFKGKPEPRFVFQGVYNLLKEGYHFEMVFMSGCGEYFYFPKLSAQDLEDTPAIDGHVVLTWRIPEGGVRCGHKIPVNAIGVPLWLPEGWERI